MDHTQQQSTPLFVRRKLMRQVGSGYDYKECMNIIIVIISLITYLSACCVVEYFFHVCKEPSFSCIDIYVLYKTRVL